MFQSFENPSEGAASAARVRDVREQLAAQSLDALIIPHSDEYQNEYLPAAHERLAWISGFTGSAGTAILTQDKAVIFVDGRYTLQVRDQIDRSVFEPVDLMTQAPSDWLKENIGARMRIGFDPWLHTVREFQTLTSACQSIGAELVQTPRNLIDAAWDDQPPLPKRCVVVHDIKYAGKSSKEKRRALAEKLQQDKVDAAVLTDLSSIAWLLNIRGSDVVHTPLILCRAILGADNHVDLFIEDDRIDAQVRDHLGPDILLHPPDSFDEALRTLGGANRKVRIDLKSTPYKVYDLLRESGAELDEGEDPCTHPKAVKSDAERIGAREAHHRDGVALCRFLAWLDEAAERGGVTEIAAARQLEMFRAQSNVLKDISFDTISGSGPNGAIVHYRVTEDTDRALRAGELYLVDSGAQYLDGTTDVTRTVAIGTPGDEMRNRFTLVLKGHIALATARFPKGTSGAQLDILARQALWQSGLDFDHGTGHGVGSYLSVHEGPQGISKRADIALEPGMIVSNEPGYYKSGAFGIRIENLVLVTEPAEIEDRFGAERPMLGFETLTLAPIDRRLIDTALLAKGEIDWLNDYHCRVAQTIGPELDAKTRAWLERATAPL